ncbi:MAG: helix-turn-helix transcriptional regulator [Candidatus Dormibacteria bacterium]
MTPRRRGPDSGGSVGSARLYNRIAVLRAERELSRYQLAEAVGVNYQTVGYLERGEYNPSLDLALRLAELFELPIEAIFSREPLRPMSEELYASERKRMLRSSE